MDPRKSCLLLIGSLLGLLTACSSLQLVPVQMARNVQFENYRQTFTIDKNKIACPSDLGDIESLDCHRAVNKRIDVVFTELVGKDNWRLLKDKYGLGPLRDELLARRLTIIGTLNMHMSLDVNRDLEHFLLEGGGWFYLLREQTNQILMTGNFRIVPNTYSIEKLAEGVLDVPVSLLIGSIPGNVTYLNDSNVIYRIKVDTSQAKHSVFSIDYDGLHEVYLSRGSRVDESSEPIATLEFESKSPESKVIDLRGRNFLRRDYQ